MDPISGPHLFIGALIAQAGWTKTLSRRWSNCYARLSTFFFFFYI